MPDYTVTPAQQGIYETVLPAGVEKTITVARANTISSVLTTSVQISVHDAASPVYFSLKTVTPKDPAATIIMPGTWLDLDLTGTDNTIHLVCASAATVSVYRT